MNSMDEIIRAVNGWGKPHHFGKYTTRLRRRRTRWFSVSPVASEAGPVEISSEDY